MRNINSNCAWEPLGTELNVNKTGCMACGDGMYSPDTITACLVCEPGKVPHVKGTTCASVHSSEMRAYNVMRTSKYSALARAYVRWFDINNKLKQ